MMYILTMNKLQILYVVFFGVCIMGCETVATTTTPPPAPVEPSFAVAEPSPVIVPVEEPVIVAVEEPVIEPIEPVVVYFTQDSALLSERANASLRALSNNILQRIDTIQSVTIEGHVVNAGTLAGQMRISRARAENVARYLVATGVPESFISTVARGAAYPVASNSTEEGRTVNRRTEITVQQK